MAIKAPIELYRRSIPEGLKTKDLFFVALQDKLTVIKPKELNKNGIKIVGYVDVEQGDFTGMYDRLSSKAKKLLDVCRSYIYDDNTDWDYSLDFNC